jgi:hypothetical protein
VQLSTFSSLLGDYSRSSQGGAAGGGTAGAPPSLVWPLAALLLTLLQLAAIVCLPSAYMRVRHCIVAWLNVLRTIAATQVSTILPLPAVGGGPLVCRALSWQEAATAAVLKSGVGAYSLASLLFPVPYKVFLPSAVVLGTVMLFLYDPVVCAAPLAAALPPDACAADAAGAGAAAPLACAWAAGEAGQDVASSWGAGHVPALMALWHPEAHTTWRLDCELSLFGMQLLLGVLLPSLLIYSQELRSRRQFAAASRAEYQQLDASRLALRGEHWRQSVALLYGIFGAACLLHMQLLNVFYACMHLHLTQALWVLLA